MTDIAAERGMFALQGLVLRSREQWGSRFDYSGARPVEVPASRVFLHIAVVTPTTMDATQRLIENIGISRFPSTGMSYNASVWFDGTLLEGQPLTRRGAHTVNDKGLTSCPTHGGPLTAPGSPMNLNVNSRAIVLPQALGNEVTDAQVHGVAKWAAAQIRGGYMLRDVTWHGHRCVAFKDCPGAAGYARLPQIQQLTAHYVTNGLGGDDDMTPEQDSLLRQIFNATHSDNMGDRVLMGTVTHRFDAPMNVVLGDTLAVVQNLGAKLDANAVAIDALAKLIGDSELNDLTAAQVKTVVAEALKEHVPAPPTPS